MLNRKYILEKLNNYLNDAREISAEEFDLLFSALTKKEQYEVICIMIEENIEYVDEKSTISDVCVSNKKGEIVYSKNINDYKNLSSALLCKLYREGNSVALDALILKNRRYVCKVAMSSLSKYPGVTLELEDVVQEGTLGVIEAAKRFDLEQDNAFLTYADAWIRQRIARAIINTGYTIRLPVHVFEKIIRITRLRRTYPLLAKAELIEKLKCEKLFNVDLSISDFNRYFNYSELYLDTTSLNMLVGEDGDSELIDFIPDENADEPYQFAEKANLSKELKDILHTLSPAEQVVIILRYGLMDGCPRTLDEIGKRYGLTRERIRQIEKKAMRKLRHPTRASRLKIFLEE